MATTAMRFYPHTTEWDGTDPASGDVRKLVLSLPAADTTSGCQFGGSGSKEITVDPYTAGRTTTGVDSAFGWAIDLAGADGMDSTATAKRFIPAGAWLFQGTISSTAVSLNNVRVRVTVYRVAAAPSTTRTELFNHIQPSGGITTSAGLNWSITTASQDAVILEAGESIQVTYSLTGTGQVGNLEVKFETGDGGLTNDTLLDVPSPGVRTNHYETVTVTGVGTALRGALQAAHTAQTTAVGTAAVDRQVVAARTVAVTAVGTASRTLNVTVNPITTTAVATASGFIEIPIDKIPDTSDYSGSDPTAEITGTIYDSTGAPVEGATVKLFRQSDDVKIAETTSAADGTYSFTRDTADPNTYYVAAYDSVTSHGLSDRDVTP